MTPGVQNYLLVFFLISPERRDRLGLRLAHSGHTPLGSGPQPSPWRMKTAQKKGWGYLALMARRASCRASKRDLPSFRYP